MVDVYDKRASSDPTSTKTWSEHSSGMELSPSIPISSKKHLLEPKDLPLQPETQARAQARTSRAKSSHKEQDLNPNEQPCQPGSKVQAQSRSSCTKTSHKQRVRNLNSQPLRPEAEVEAEVSIPGELRAQTELPSLGSALHESGKCKPCVFFPKGSCASSSHCRFCHYTHKFSRPRPGKDKRKNAQTLVNFLCSRCETTAELSQLAGTLRCAYASRIMGIKMKEMPGPPQTVKPADDGSA